jgi:hypothetical protein
MVVASTNAREQKILVRPNGPLYLISFCIVMIPLGRVIHDAEGVSETNVHAGGLNLPFLKRLLSVVFCSSSIFLIVLSERIIGIPSTELDMTAIYSTKVEHNQVYATDAQSA